MNKPLDPWTHAPLPYIVKVRTTLTDDSAPQITEHRVTAYSFMEALIQATMEVGGFGLNDARYQVESISPDLEKYAAHVMRSHVGEH